MVKQARMVRKRFTITMKEKIKIKSIALPQFEGKTRREVYDYVKKEYPNQLPSDGVDFYDNECLKDGDYHFFFGSVFRSGGGDWSVPYVQWDGSEFYRDGSWLGSDWDADSRVVILDNIESLPLSLESLQIELADQKKRIEKLEGLFNSNLLK